MKKKTEEIVRKKGLVKAIDTELFKSGYQEVEYWEINGLTADNIEGKLTLLRLKINEILERLNQNEK